MSFEAATGSLPARPAWSALMGVPSYPNGYDGTDMPVILRWVWWLCLMRNKSLTSARELSMTCTELFQKCILFFLFCTMYPLDCTGANSPESLEKFAMTVISGFGSEAARSTSLSFCRAHEMAHSRADENCETSGLEKNPTEAASILSIPPVCKLSSCWP